MKNYALAALVAASLLVACSSGGGSSPTPILPTIKPTTPFTIKFKVIGGAEPQSIAINTADFKPLDVVIGTPQPVLLIAPDSQPQPNLFGVGGATTSALAIMSVSPQPSSSPTATWSSSDVNLSVRPDSTDSSQAGTFAITPNVSSMSTIGAVVKIAGQSDTSITPPDIIYKRITIACPLVSQGSNVEWVQGIAYDSSGNPSAQSSPATSDIYVSGNDCLGSFKNLSESEYTIHFPFGGHAYLDTYKSILDLNLSDLQTDQTSLTLSALQTNPVPHDILTFKDSHNLVHFVKFAQYGGRGPYTGAEKICGHTIDLSC